MKKLKHYIDALPNDKKGHLVFGNIINPFIIVGFLVVGCILNKLVFKINILFFGYLGVIGCCLFHYQIERWQRKTGKGKFELWDAFAGSFSGLLIGLVILSINVLKLNKC